MHVLILVIDNVKIFCIVGNSQGFSLVKAGFNARVSGCKAYGRIQNKLVLKEGVFYGSVTAAFHNLNVLMVEVLKVNDSTVSAAVRVVGNNVFL